MTLSPRSRANAVRLLALLLVVSLLAPAGVSALTYDPSTDTSLEPGTITSPANGSTVISVQGYTFQGNTNPKKPARLLSVGPRGDLQWTHNDSVGGSAWFFDVDPLPNGNLLVSSPRAGDTVVFELNPETQERVWQERFNMTDTHDVAYLGDDRIAIANMREWNASAEVSDDRIVIYNRSTGEFTWEWYFKNHFPESTDGGYNDDWSHVNDVDPVGEDRLLLSPRNFDQAIVVDIESKEIVERLGSDDDYDVMREQHNPDWLLSENGTPTILVADSGNNRVVEYAKEDGEWVRTWEVGTGSLTWPRDADRLPNGNTLVTDTLNHRVMELTPTGEVVWEYYATWGPYDAERIGTGPESSGPTIRDLNASGSYDITGSANLTAGGNESVGFAGRIRATFAGTALEGPMNEFATRWAHVTPWLRPVWMSGWDFVWAISALLVGLVWAGGELIAGRQQIVAGIRRLADR
ncbi:aryl-sulfate sulfotransferase [Halobellus sp. H-GB7]|uniref:aryl-sulfate sulfotransferase n=1 Tax=Halobellus sp. H-GB7 TaxID=3069756 RepID=UPI0027AEFFDF|nr:aryl-sulfate sulfotransferase [Halobellus sp. H-GB7]MDQ2054945.1 aryl-sulfate sulfotransferase [Halobellus sp. H-GB7]